MNSKILNQFSPETAQWFTSSVGTPTKVQEEAWPAIASGQDTLVSAPTGTGKTLSAFLVFIDRMKQEAREGTLKQELQLIYISPLKSLAGDIRENLKRPLDGICCSNSKLEREENIARGKKQKNPVCSQVEAAIRTGDTTQSERRAMVKRPPHILITTPESLYLLLTSRSGQMILKSARTIILDELHAIIDTKRGAHLMFSVARLDRLCGRSLQRIGLSATIEPLLSAAVYLSPETVKIVAPAMKKKVEIRVSGPMPMIGKKRKDPVWEEVGQSVYDRCQGKRSVIAFTEGRRYAEKLAYYVNQAAGIDFARVHHGSLSKEQRSETEMALKEGRLRLLCATSSMELGIDVGEVDEVLQIGCPRTVSSTMQRLGRAGHNPGRTSVMHMYPRTAPECILCAMTAEIARRGGVEYARPPRLCLDILAQHLVSMAVDGGYDVGEVLELTGRAYPFRDVTKSDVESVFRMLAGDYEHSREIPVRPRILYDRIHGTIHGDTYSRMLAIHAGGTIPDKGLYTVKNEEGIKLGELDEEFVYESRLGDTFQLGSFAWRIVGQNKDTVVVTQAALDGARMPFWKGEIKGRALRTSLAFGRLMQDFAQAQEEGELENILRKMGLDDAAAENGAGFLRRQIEATGVLPDHKTILVEHFADQNGNPQVMIHSLFGRQVNAPLAILLQYTARKLSGINVGCVDDEEGVLLYPYGEVSLPEGLLYRIDIREVRGILEAELPQTPVFSMNFRYNAARALMMGMKLGGRQPLWMQRLKSTQLMDSLMTVPDHPLIRETKRECLEENWDLAGLSDILERIQDGRIEVREVYTEVASPMSLPFQWQAEAAEMYEYVPTTPGIRQAVYEELRQMDQIRPSREELDRAGERKKMPEDEAQLHSLLMIEGDLEAGELDVPAEWMKGLAAKGQVTYIEPGLWIAAEQREEYESGLLAADYEALEHIVRRLLYYRGPMTAFVIAERYLLDRAVIDRVLKNLLEAESVTAEEDVFYHSKLYDRARNATIKNMRHQAVTQPALRYASLMEERAGVNDVPEEQLKLILNQYAGKSLPVSAWEEIIFPGRVKRYSEKLLDRLLAEGEFFWKMLPQGNLCFFKYDEIDWQLPMEEALLTDEESLLYEELKRRGASFLNSLSSVLPGGNVQEVFLSLAEKGLVCADSFVPVRQWRNQGRLEKATVRQRVNVRVKALSSGRWDVTHPVRSKGMEELLEQLFREKLLLCGETFRDGAMTYEGYLPKGERTWQKALELLSIWEFTGKVRRGYFIKGFSGAQFVLKRDFALILQEPEPFSGRIRWFNANDPAQVWGKVLEHMEGRSFMNVPGTAVALAGGIPVAVSERQGKTLRIFDPSLSEASITAFAKAYENGTLYTVQKRIVIKEYPDGLDATMKNAGFIREMHDYVLYR